MDSRDWELLKVVFEEKNLSKAAERLFISQPSVTYRIQQLEKELQTNIIFKSNKGIEFTAEGERIVEYCHNMLAEQQKLLDSIASMSREVSGTLRLGVANSYAHYKMPSILTAFSQKYPQVKIMLKAGFSYDIMDLLYKDKIHIAIESSGANWQDQHVKIENEDIIIISKAELELDSLPDLPMIKYGAIPYLKQKIENWWQSKFTSLPKVMMEVEYADTCKEMVSHGLGYGIVPAFCLREHDNLYTYPLKDQQGNPVFREIWMNYRESSLKLPVVEKFITFLNER